MGLIGPLVNGAFKYNYEIGPYTFVLYTRNQTYIDLPSILQKHFFY